MGQNAFTVAAMRLEVEKAEVAADRSVHRVEHGFVSPERPVTAEGARGVDGAEHGGEAHHDEDSTSVENRHGGAP